MTATSLIEVVVYSPCPLSLCPEVQGPTNSRVRTTEIGAEFPCSDQALTRDLSAWNMSPMLTGAPLAAGLQADQHCDIALLKAVDGLALRSMSRFEHGRHLNGRAR